MPADFRIGLDRAAAVVSLFCLLPTPALMAQEEFPSFLPSSMVPNYDQVRIGQTEGLEGSAFVARTDDAAANWYNPAGLVLSDRTTLNASANAYQYTRLTAEGLGSEFGSGRFKSLGTYFGGVVGSPILKSRSVRLGFSFSRPVAWSPGAITANAEYDVSGVGLENINSYSKVEFQTSVPAIAAGFRLSDDLRLGAGTSMSITSMVATQQFTNRLLAPSEAGIALLSLQLDGQLLQLQFTGSAQWDVTDAVTIGATATSPGLQLSGSGQAGFQSVVGLPAGSSDALFQDSDASFEYKLPYRLVGGVAVDLGRFEVEADVRYYGSRDAYNLIESDLPVRIVVTDASGNPTASTRPFEPLVEETKAVTNVAIGGSYSLSETFKLHLGFHTDNTPVGNPGESIFRAVDLTGISGGVSFGGRLSGSLGFSSSWGTTEDRQIGPTLAGQSSRTKIGIQTFNLYYAISYDF